MNAIDLFHFILPEATLFVFSLGILVSSLSPKGRTLSGPLALVGVLAATLSLSFTRAAAGGLFFHMLANDPFSLFFKVICLFITGIVILFSMGQKSLPEESLAEYYFLILTGAIAMLLAVSSNHLVMIYIALEMLSLVSYILVGFAKRDQFSSEGAIKYFLFGALSTGIMLYGISLAYGLFGTLDLSLIVRVLAAGGVHAGGAILVVLMILAGLSFKCALVPFHLWVPDAYQGAPTAVTAFISAGPKAVGFAILLRLFAISFSSFSVEWVHLASLIAVLTMTVGNVIAISQTDIKRMLAYSSIAQAGYIFIGFIARNALGMEGVFYYLLAYALMNLGAFGCVILISNSIKSDAIEDYAGLSQRAPLTAFMLTVFLLSLVGVPPLAGFLGKFLVFASAIQSQLILLAVVGVINSVIAAFYYMNIVKFMYLHKPKGATTITRSIPLEIALWVVLAGVLIVGLYPQPFLNGIKASQFVFFR